MGEPHSPPSHISKMVLSTVKIGPLLRALRCTPFCVRNWLTADRAVGGGHSGLEIHEALFAVGLLIVVAKLLGMV